MRQPAIMLSAMLLAFAAGFGGRWLVYVAVSGQADDRAGVGLTPYMPQPLRAWGCERLRQRFPDEPPPPGC